MKVTSTWFVPVGLLLILLMGWGVYYPGLGSGFLLDDYQNLQTLERISTSPSLQQYASVVLTNPSGDWGRGVSMLSFAVQHASWPADPEAFKRVNLILHLLNGVLFYGLSVRLLAFTQVPDKRSKLIAVMATAFWLLNPMQVSTVLYVVQRMTELSAFFILLGLLVYMMGREKVLERSIQGYVIMTLGLLIFGLLAVLSKENGILLPLFILVLEFTLFRAYPKPLYWKIWKLVVFWVPILGGLVYSLMRFLPLVLAGYSQRNFSLMGRVLTEARALTDYLSLLLLPRLGGLGVFHDDYVVSHSLFDPPWTAGAVLLVLALILSAFVVRKRWPIYSFAVLWFFAGHLLESTIIPLELYFEHRNYFPSMGLFLGVAYGMNHLVESQTSKWMRYMLTCFVLVWVVMLSVMTWNENKTWSDPTILAFKLSLDHPDSMRANLQLAEMKFRNGDVAGAENIYTSLAVQEPGLAASQMALGCFGKSVPIPSVESAEQALRTAHFSKYPFSGMEQIVVLKENGGCQNLPSAGVLRLFDAILQNPNFVSRRYAYWVMKGRFLVADKSWPQAMASFDEAYALNPNVEVALVGARTLVLSGHPENAEKYIKLARQANERNVLSKYTYEKDIEDWERRLRSMSLPTH